MYCRKKTEKLLLQHAASKFWSPFFFQKPYKCRQEGCEKRYTDPSSLRKHVKSVHVAATSQSGASDSKTGVSHQQGYRLDALEDEHEHVELLRKNLGTE